MTGINEAAASGFSSFAALIECKTKRLTARVANNGLPLVPLRD